MNRKTVFRTLAIISGIMLMIWLFSFLSDDTRGWESVDTSVALTQLEDKANVKNVQIDDKEQQLRIELNNGNEATSNNSKIVAINRFENREFQPGPMMLKARKLYWDWAQSTR